MRSVEPKVYLIAEPIIDTEGMLAYLREVGGEEWFNRNFYENLAMHGGEPGESSIMDRHTNQWVPGAEALVEFMGRLCYRSWSPGLNKNVTKVREDRGDYLLNILRSAHGSVLEHAMFNFVIHNGSRVFTAEMNRHKAGTAISEQSLRYVRLDDLPFWEPSGLSEATLAAGRQLIQDFEQFYLRACAEEGLDDPDADFTHKKTVTSKLRRWAPMGMGTEEGWSGNVRAIRHVIEMRTAPGAEEEIRIIANQIADIMLQRCPLLFGDYEFDASDPPAWTTQHRKV